MGLIRETGRRESTFQNVDSPSRRNTLARPSYLELYFQFRIQRGKRSFSTWSISRAVEQCLNTLSSSGNYSSPSKKHPRLATRMMTRQLATSEETEEGHGRVPDMYSTMAETRRDVSRQVTHASTRRRNGRLGTESHSPAPPFSSPSNIINTCDDKNHFTVRQILRCWGRNRDS